MQCHGWPRSDERVEAYLRALHELDSGDLEPWASRYARGGSVDRIAWDIDYLLRKHAISTCLNVGGAPYIFEFLMRSARPDIAITTLDLEPGRFPGVQKTLNIDLRQMDVETASEAQLAALGKFDCIVLTEVFEHMRIDLLGTLTRLRACLSEKGVLYLSTPNGLRLSSFTQAYFQGRTGPSPVKEWQKLEQLGHMGHVREYSMQEVCETLAYCGYRVEDALYRFGMRRPVSLAARLRNLTQSLVCRVIPASANNMVIVARR